MISRYDGRKIGKNDSKVYKKIFKNRDVRFINQYDTANLKYPSPSELAGVEIYDHVWSLGDRFYKLADRYYNDPKLWWVLAWFNRTPTETHLEIGDIVNIPVPLERVLQFLDV